MSTPADNEHLRAWHDFLDGCRRSVAQVSPLLPSGHLTRINGLVMEAAAWAETIPFTETRGYVKNVLANTTAYAALITGQPQSLKARLGTVGPRDGGPEPNRDLP